MLILCLTKSRHFTNVCMVMGTNVPPTETSSTISDFLELARR